MLMCSTWVALDNHHRREALLLLGLPVTLSPLDPWLPDVTPALGCPPSMADTIFSSGNDQWVCPNDRQLALRAKLQTGWSVHTYQTEKQRRSQCLSPEELEVILQVIQRAERLDILEQQRIGRLVERLETMQRNVLGNGLSQCLLCGEVLGFLGSSSVFCKDCRKQRTETEPWRRRGRDAPAMEVPAGQATEKPASNKWCFCSGLKDTQAREEDCEVRCVAVKAAARKSAPNAESRPPLARSGPCGCVRSAVSKERSGRGQGPGSTKGSPSTSCPSRLLAGLMTLTSDLCLWSPQNHGLRVLKPAASTHGPEGELLRKLGPEDHLTNVGTTVRPCLQTSQSVEVLAMELLWPCSMCDSWRTGGLNSPVCSILPSGAWGLI
ncbi:rab effector Noc2 isoform X3 [Meriones unguiculatus]|uniref:rab effector Noc2 isoform X3 n=1 Tax=Meriones unguiculatus TaxID=10047 RepID=UPI00293E095E|nr:rab effector Noc2 isoform X3 [Meriones unguiculatus]